MGYIDYFGNLSNYSDCIYNWASIVNLLLQNILGPYHIMCKLLMIVIVLQVIIKTFFFLRIFPQLTPIIVMLKVVFYDLRIFMLFYFILIVMFA